MIKKLAARVNINSKSSGGNVEHWKRRRLEHGQAWLTPGTTLDQLWQMWTVKNVYYGSTNARVKFTPLTSVQKTANSEHLSATSQSTI